ncbi:deoxyuridine 5'-triphosphate nucleotidohydrolase [Syntrophotalea acetylenivorans]|uniref:Deoxyuridine 5'-triphosphate nucleotidohydrolase n=1 Tax=Syntrophotalea acetylenivorans TaxID=1842532 RepID=A0A1L3GLT0_9BACT|nr:dUTP diphosphatase [Syntrophotalea acetylenivorans]APG26906.1 deoxyuridine 5'-triphosphate nucleotidohydrolase [Syntrophotalea acetylenivorans]
MSMVDVQVKLLRDTAQLPVYMTELAAGMDLFACLEESQQLLPGQRCLIPTGIALAIPAGYEGQVRPRSGLAIKKGLSLVNAPGTIDADYRGEIKVVMINHGQEPVTIACGDRIAQLIITPVHQASLTLVDELDTTAREAGGFGHTG